MRNEMVYILDFDSTIVTCESLDELARLSLEKSSHRDEIMTKLGDITSQGMDGRIGFEESLRRRLQLFQPTEEHIQKLVEYLLTCVTPSLQARKDWLVHNKDRIYVVSGGFEEYIRPVIASLGLLPDNVYANRFTYDATRAINGFDTSRHTSKVGGKAAQVRALEFDGHVVAIGDGYTDYEIKSAGEADQFWAYIEHVMRPTVTAKADRVLKSFAEV